MRIFITGGSGFVGGHLIERLAASHEVLAMARSDASAAKVSARGARPVRCSLEDITAEHLAGVDVVVHAAAAVEEFGPLADFERANVGGTQRVLDGAREAGVARFVQISTNATVFTAGSQLGVDESAPYTALAAFHYGTTKAEAERRVLAANGEGLTTLALRPCFVWGPGDTTLLPGLLRMVEEGSFVWLSGGRARVSTTHVFNLVDAVECALTEGRGGRAYFVADAEDTDVRGFLSGLAASADVELPTRSVPASVVRGLAAVLEGAWRGLGRTGLPPVTRMAAWLMSSDMTVSTRLARAELGWTPEKSRRVFLPDLAA